MGKIAICKRHAIPLILLLGFYCESGSAKPAPTAGQYKTVTYTLVELLGPEQANRLGSIIPVDKEITWTIYLPNKKEDMIPGVFVYVSPTKSGDLDKNWVATLDQQNMIYIAANESGNKTLVNRRMLMALMALNVLEQLTQFDPTQVFISGFSGGGRVASKVATQYPSIFHGALYICGVDKWNNKQREKLALIKKNRFVFLTGSGDFNRQETRKVYKYYVNAGIEQSKLITVKGMSHQHPNADSFKQALQYLRQQEQ